MTQWHNWLCRCCRSERYQMLRLNDILIVVLDWLDGGGFVYHDSILRELGKFKVILKVVVHRGASRIFCSTKAWKTRMSDWGPRGSCFVTGGLKVSSNLRQSMFWADKFMTSRKLNTPASLNALRRGESVGWPRTVVNMKSTSDTAAILRVRCAGLNRSRSGLLVLALSRRAQEG